MYLDSCNAHETLASNVHLDLSLDSVHPSATPAMITRQYLSLCRQRRGLDAYIEYTQKILARNY